jgi:hypothetical protein
MKCHLCLTRCNLQRGRGKILLIPSKWLGDQLVKAGVYEQGAELVRSGQPDHDGICLTASMYWIKACMKFDSANSRNYRRGAASKYHRKGVTATEKLRDKTTKLVQWQIGWEKPELRRELENAAQNNLNLMKQANATSAEIAAVRAQTAAMGKDLENGFVPNAEQWAYLDQKITELQELCATAKLCMQEAALWSAKHYELAPQLNYPRVDVGSGVSIKEPMKKLADKYGLKLEGKAKGVRANGNPGAVVSNLIPYGSYFLYGMEMEGL